MRWWLRDVPWRTKEQQIDDIVTRIRGQYGRPVADTPRVLADAIEELAVVLLSRDKPDA